MISFFKGWLHFLFLRRSEKARLRLSVCDDCSYRRGFVCGVCGCPLGPKAESDDDCPRGYWDAFKNVKGADPPNRIDPS